MTSAFDRWMERRYQNVAKRAAAIRTALTEYRIAEKEILQQYRAECKNEASQNSFVQEPS